MSGGRWLKESAGPQVKMLGRLEKIEWGVRRGECWGTDLGISSEECKLGCEFPEGVEDSEGKWKVQLRSHGGVLRCKGTAAFLLFPGENRCPDLGRLRIKNFSFTRLGGASRLGPAWQGLELSHSRS